MKSFVIKLLTDQDFFPGYGAALAPNFTEDSPEIGQIAEQLGDALKQAAPAETNSDNEWPSFDALTLELSDAAIREMWADGTDAEARLGIVRHATEVICADKYCPQLFRLPGIEEGTTLEQLFGHWRDANEGKPEDWAHELTRQVAEASAGRFPKIRWSTMHSSERKDSYVPGVHRVRKIPAEGRTQFDVYFLPVLKPAGAGEN